MNALIFVLILAFAPGSTEASAASVWLFLVVVEWLADRFAGWLAKRWSMSHVRARSRLPLVNHHRVTGGAEVSPCAKK